ncbi:MAG: 8-oxo-dGTP pyrophosphatase MutT (NUDIX family) [Candidatus Azotimanducaceae bacterium]|jgi:8-oxo-dGTP pyrophosphatase MutT (NUDIX family)
MSIEIKPWVRQDSQLIADCRIFKVKKSIEVSPRSGEPSDFFVIDSADWVNVVPITEDNELVCVRQYRHGAAKITLEIPGGMVDPGELPKIAAARECLEETGYEASQLVSLGCLSPNPALFPNSLHTWIARDVRATAQIQNESTEHTEVQLVPLSQVPDLLLSGEIDHALAVATLWRALHYLRV